MYPRGGGVTRGGTAAGGRLPLFVPAIYYYVAGCRYKQHVQEDANHLPREQQLLARTSGTSGNGQRAPRRP